MSPEPDACTVVRPTGWDGDEDSEPLPHVAVVLRWPAEEPDSIDRKGLAPEHWTWELVDPAGDVLLSGYADDDPAATLQTIVDAFHATTPKPEPERCTICRRTRAEAGGICGGSSTMVHVWPEPAE